MSPVGSLDQHGSTSINLSPGPADLDYSMMEFCNRPMISELENRKKNIPYAIGNIQIRKKHPIFNPTWYWFWICGIRFCSTFCIDPGSHPWSSIACCSFLCNVPPLVVSSASAKSRTKTMPGPRNGKGNLRPGNSSWKEGSVSDGLSCLILPNK